MNAAGKYISEAALLCHFQLQEDKLEGAKQNPDSKSSKMANGATHDS